MLLFFIIWGYLFSPLFDFYHIFIYVISTLPRMYYVTNQMIKWNILCRRYLNVLRDVICNETYQRNTFDSKIGFVFISSCLWEGACLINVICVCLYVMVSITYRVVFLFCFSSSCVPYAANFSGLYFFYYPFSILYRLFMVLCKCQCSPYPSILTGQWKFVFDELNCVFLSIMCTLYYYTVQLTAYTDKCWAFERLSIQCWGFIGGGKSWADVQFYYPHL